MRLFELLNVSKIINFLVNLLEWFLYPSTTVKNVSIAFLYFKIAIPYILRHSQNIFMAYKYKNLFEKINKHNDIKTNIFFEYE